LYWFSILLFKIKFPPNLVEIYFCLSEHLGVAIFSLLYRLLGFAEKKRFTFVRKDIIQ